MIRRIGIVANPEKREALLLAEEAEVFFRANAVETVRFDLKTERNAEPDLMLTFGGDGTFLIGARYAIQYDIPLMGINLGTMGFLTEGEPESLKDILRVLLAETYETEERSLLSIRAEKSGEQFLALNDAVMTRGGYARLIRVECRVNGELYNDFTADGILAATPTGSTGYSLSAGGPIVEPGMECIILTPVCAHSLHKCPCVVSHSSEIRLRLRADRQQTAVLQIDGMNRGTLEAGDEIMITGARKKIRLIRIHPYSFFSVVHNKLIEWSSEHN